MTTQEYVKSLIPASIKENNKHYQAVFDAIVMALESCKDVNKYTLIKAGFVYVDCYRDRKTSAVLMLQMALAAADLAVCEFVEAVKPRNSHKLEVNALYNKIISVRKMVSTAKTLDKAENDKMRSNLFSTGGAMFEVVRYLSLVNDVDIDKFVGELVELAEKYISNDSNSGDND